MAEKHENNPSKASTTKTSKYRKTADFGLNSASAWNDFNLHLLGAEYVKETYNALPDAVGKFSLKEQNDTLRKCKLLNGRANDKGMNASSMVRRQCQRTI